jgi:hypothetical protein
MTNLSHNASFHSNEWITPSNRGIKHLTARNHPSDFRRAGSREVFGDYGIDRVHGGAARFEVDKFNPSNGTPRNALNLATSEPLKETIEEVKMSTAPIAVYYSPAAPTEHGQADIVFFETPNGGAMFSTGSITWMSSTLENGFDNDVAKITLNVVNRFLDPASFSTPTQDDLAGCTTCASQPGIRTRGPEIEVGGGHQSKLNSAFKPPKRPSCPSPSPSLVPARVHDWQCREAAPQRRDGLGGVAPGRSGPLFKSPNLSQGCSRQTGWKAVDVQGVALIETSGKVPTGSRNVFSWLEMIPTLLFVDSSFLSKIEVMRFFGRSTHGIPQTPRKAIVENCRIHQVKSVLSSPDCVRSSTGCGFCLLRPHDHLVC